MARLAVRLVGTELPGLRHQECEHVHVGVQRGREVVDLVAGDAERAVFDLDVNVVPTDAGLDYRGPYVHGKQGERFLYLSWGERGPGQEFAMFRRAKLHLSVWDAEQVQQALQEGLRMEGALRLSDSCGAPLCASVRPPVITWRPAP